MELGNSDGRGQHLNSARNGTGMYANVPQSVAEMQSEGPSGANMISSQFTGQLIDDYRTAMSNSFVCPVGLNDEDARAFSDFTMKAIYKLLDSNSVAHGRSRAGQCYLLWRLIKKIPDAGVYLVLGATYKELKQLAAQKPNARFIAQISTREWRDQGRIKASLHEAEQDLGSPSAAVKSIASNYIAVMNSTQKTTVGTYFIKTDNYLSIPFFKVNAMISVDSIYDLDPLDLIKFLKSFGNPILWSIRHVCRELKHTDRALNPILGFEWDVRRVTINPVVNMIMSDQSTAYTHDYFKFIQYSKSSITSGTVILASEPEWKNYGYGIFKMYLAPVPLIHLRTYFSMSEGHIVYGFSLHYYWETGRIRRFPMTLAKYAALLRFVMATETDAKKLVNFMRSSLSQFSMGKVLVDESWDCYKVDVFDVICFAVMHGVLQRNAIIETIREVANLINKGEFAEDNFWEKIWKEITHFIDRILIFIGVKGRPLLELFEELMSLNISTNKLKIRLASLFAFDTKVNFVEQINIDNARDLIAGVGRRDGYRGENLFSEMSKRFCGEELGLKDLTRNHASDKIFCMNLIPRGKIIVEDGALPGGHVIDYVKTGGKAYLIREKVARINYKPFEDKELYSDAIKFMPYDDIHERFEKKFYPWNVWRKPIQVIYGMQKSPKPSWFISDCASASDHGHEQVMILGQSFAALKASNVKRGLLKCNCILNKNLIDSQGRLTDFFRCNLKDFKLKPVRNEAFSPISYEFYIKATRRRVRLHGAALDIHLFNLNRRILEIINKVYSTWVRFAMYYEDHKATVGKEFKIEGWVDPDASNVQSFRTKRDSKQSADLPDIDDGFDIIYVGQGDSKSESLSEADVRSLTSDTSFTHSKGEESGKLGEEMLIYKQGPIETISEEFTVLVMKPVEYTGSEGKLEEIPKVGKFFLNEVPQNNLQTSKVVTPDRVVPQLTMYVNYEPLRPFANGQGNIPNSTSAPKFINFETGDSADESDDPEDDGNMTIVRMEKTDKKYIEKEVVAADKVLKQGEHISVSVPLQGGVKVGVDMVSKKPSDMRPSKELETFAEKNGYHYVAMEDTGACVWRSIACLLLGSQWRVHTESFDKLLQTYAANMGIPKVNGQFVYGAVKDCEDLLDRLLIDYIVLNDKYECITSSIINKVARPGIVVLWDKKINGKSCPHADVLLYTKFTKNRIAHPLVRPPMDMIVPAGFAAIKLCEEMDLIATSELFKTWIASDSTVIEVKGDLAKMRMRFWAEFAFMLGVPGCGKTFAIAKMIAKIPEEGRKRVVYISPRRGVRDDTAIAIGKMVKNLRTDTANKGWADKEFAIKTYLKVFKLINTGEKPHISVGAVELVILDEFTLIPDILIFGLMGLFPNAKFICVGDVFQQVLDPDVYPELTGAKTILDYVPMKTLTTPSHFVSVSNVTRRMSAMGVAVAKSWWGGQDPKPEIYSVNDDPFVFQFPSPNGRIAWTRVGRTYVHMIDSKSVVGILPAQMRGYMTVSQSQGMTVDTNCIWFGPNSFSNFKRFPQNGYVAFSRARNGIVCFTTTKEDQDKIFAHVMLHMTLPNCPTDSMQGKMRGGEINANKEAIAKGELHYDVVKEWAFRGVHVADGPSKKHHVSMPVYKHVARPNDFNLTALMIYGRVPYHVDNSRNAMYYRAQENAHMTFFKDRFDKIERVQVRFSQFSYGKQHFAADSVAALNTFVGRAVDHLKRSAYKRAVASHEGFMQAVKATTRIYFQTFVDEKKYNDLFNKVIVDQEMIAAWNEFTHAAKLTPSQAEITMQEIRWRLNGFLKQQCKPKGFDAAYANSGGQPVVAGEKIFNLAFSLMFRVFKKLSAHSFKDEFKYATGMTEEEMYLHYKKYKDFYPDSWDDMSDCSAYDATMDIRTDVAEAARWMLFSPWDKDLKIYYWLKRYRPVYLKFMVYGKSEARGSGEPDTEAGNTNTNMAFNAAMLNGSALSAIWNDQSLKVKPVRSNNPMQDPEFSWGPIGSMITMSTFFDSNQILAGLFVGDDCLILVKKRPILNNYFFRLIFMTNLKLDIKTNASEFCNHIYSPYGFCYNPHKLVEKIMSKDFATVLSDKKKWLEWREGFEAVLFRYLRDPLGANKACGAFFNAPPEYYDVLWRQLDAFSQLPFNAVSRLATLETLVRSDTYGGGIYLKTELITIDRTENLEEEMERPNKNTVRGKKNMKKAVKKEVAKDVKNFNKKANNPVKAIEKLITETPSKNRQLGPRANAAARRTTARKDKANVRNFKGKEAPLEAITMTVMDPENTMPVRISPQSSYSTALGKTKVQQKIVGAGDESIMPEAQSLIAIFKDPLRSAVYYDTQANPGAINLYEYNLLGSFTTGANEYVAPSTTPGIVVGFTNINAWQQVKILAYQSGNIEYAPHGPYLFTGMATGIEKQFVWANVGETISVTLISFPVGGALSVKPSIWANGEVNDRATTILSAAGTSQLKATGVQAAYWGFEFSGNAVGTFVFSIKIYNANTTTEGFYQLATPVFNNLGKMSEIRANSASLRVTNTTPLQTRGGNFVAIQVSGGVPWANYTLLGQGVDPKKKISEAPYSTGVQDLTNGFMGYVKPSSIDDLKFYEYVTSVNGSPLYASFPLIPLMDYVILVLDNGENPQVLTMTMAHHIEYKTTDPWVDAEISMFRGGDYEELIEALRLTPQFAENPSHWKQFIAAAKSAASKVVNGIMKYGPQVLKAAEMAAAFV